jgi:asparagine synthase (glutamine-hydrolysing)
MSFKESIPAPAQAVTFVGERQVTHRTANSLGEVSLVGQCLATPAEFEVAAEQALNTADMTPLQDLPGSHTAIMDRQAGCIVATDLAGQFRFCWQQDDKGVRLSLDGRHLGSTPSAGYLAASIICASEVTSGQTALDGVWRLEAGQTGRFTSRGVEAITDSTVFPDPTVTLADAAHSLREALTEAVVRRVELGKVMTSDFSGGFDSTTLALLAADALPTGIDAFVNYRAGLAVGDLHFAQRIADSHRNVRLHARLQDTATLPFASMATWSVAGTGPDPWTVSGASTNNYLAMLQGYGSQIHMSGDGGDGILSPPSSYMVDLARQGDYQQLRQVAQARGRLTNRDPAQIYDKALYDATRSVADDMLDLSGCLLDPEGLRDNTQPPRYTWMGIPEQHIYFLSAAARRLLSEQAERRAVEIAASADGNVANYMSLAEMRGGGEGQHYLQLHAQRYGLEVHSPYLDKRVIEACLQAPAYARALPGKFKYILQKAFSDVLPDALLSRTSKSAYDGEMYRGLRTSLNEITSLVTDNCRLADLGVIEPRRVLQELYTLDMGKQGMMAAIERVIAAEMWLRQLDGGIQ